MVSIEIGDLDKLYSDRLSELVSEIDVDDKLRYQVMKSISDIDQIAEIVDLFTGCFVKTHIEFLNQ